MTKKRIIPSEIAKLRGNVGWFGRICDNDRDWVYEIATCLAAVSDPSYHVVASRVILDLELSVNEISVVRLLKKLVKERKCQKRNPAK